MKASGEPLRALQELENAMRIAGILANDADVVDITEILDSSQDTEDRKRKDAKVCPWSASTRSRLK